LPEAGGSLPAASAKASVGFGSGGWENTLRNQSHFMLHRDYIRFDPNRVRS
jgi:hypothetical protein